ncbi:MAG: CDP-alcohol phosphatidyltransferase family protein [Planctomycetota bacterium]
MKRIHLLPNLLTLANAFCGLLAVAKAIDALAYGATDPLVFYQKMETACVLVFTGMVFDVLDGFAARITRSESAFGVQLDSFADALTFGVTPAILAKVLLEHEESVSGSGTNARVHFLAAAAFALMAILRLVRYNLESDGDDAREVPSNAGARSTGHDDEDGDDSEDDDSEDDDSEDMDFGAPVRAKKKKGFRGLPSPAAAGTVASTIWVFLIFKRPELETSEGIPTPTRRFLQWIDYEPGTLEHLLSWAPLVALGMLPILGLLMVSDVRYPHLANLLAPRKRSFPTLVAAVFAALLLYIAPVPVLFVAFTSFTIAGVVLRVRASFAARGEGSAT